MLLTCKKMSNIVSHSFIYYHDLRTDDQYDQLCIYSAYQVSLKESF